MRTMTSPAPRTPHRDRARPREGRWLKLDAEQPSVVIAFLGGPVSATFAFTDGRYVPFERERHGSRGHRSSLRAQMNVARCDTGTVHVLEMAMPLFKLVLEARRRHGGLDADAFRLERHETLEARWPTYSLRWERALLASERRRFSALPLHDLSAFGVPSPGDGESEWDSFDLGQDLDWQ